MNIECMSAIIHEYWMHECQNAWMQACMNASRMYSCIHALWMNNWAELMQYGINATIHECKVHELMRNSDSSRKTAQNARFDPQKDLLDVEFRATLASICMNSRIHECDMHEFLHTWMRYAWVIAYMNAKFPLCVRDEMRIFWNSECNVYMNDTMRECGFTWY